MATVKGVNSDIKNHRFGRALKRVESLLDGAGDDEAVQVLRVTKARVLLANEKFEDCLAAIDAAGAAAASQLQFERAYALYSLHRLKPAIALCEEALKTATGAAADRLQKVRGQSLFRLGDMKGAAAAYKAVVDGGRQQGQAKAEAEANLAAALLNAGDLSSVLDPVEAAAGADGGAGYELLYNRSCALHASGRVTDACSLQIQAEAASRAALEAEKEPEEAILSETAVIRASRASALVQLGLTSTGQELALAAESDDPADPAQAGVASAVVAASRGDRSQQDSRRRLKEALARDTARRLSATQRSAIRAGRALLLLRDRKWEEAAALATQVAADEPASAVAALVLAAVKARSTGGSDAASQALKGVLAASTGDDSPAGVAAAVLAWCTSAVDGGAAEVALASAQDAQNRGDAAGALRVLDSLPRRWRCSPAVLGGRLRLMATLAGGSPAPEEGAAAVVEAADLWQAAAQATEAAGADGAGAILPLLQAWSRSCLHIGTSVLIQSGAVAVAVPLLQRWVSAATSDEERGWALTQCAAAAAAAGDLDAARSALGNLQALASAAGVVAAGTTGATPSGLELEQQAGGSAVSVPKARAAAPATAAAGGGAEGERTHMRYSKAEEAEDGDEDEDEGEGEEGATAAGANMGPDSLLAAKQLSPAEHAALKAKRKRRQARLKQAHLAQLAEKHRLSGVPAPEPDRWLPKNQRGRRHRRRNWQQRAKSGGAAQGGGGQVDAEVEANLDARARELRGDVREAKGAKSGGRKRRGGR